jgi:hypothetical protein
MTERHLPQEPAEATQPANPPSSERETEERYLKSEGETEERYLKLLALELNTRRP